MEEKTEPPTKKKLDDARKKGQVTHSKDVVTASLLIIMLGYMWFFGEAIGQRVEHMMTLPAMLLGEDYDQAFDTVVEQGIDFIISMLSPFIIIAVAFGIMVNYIMVGPVFAFEQIKPEFKKINPAEGFKKIFAMKNVFEAIKSTIKIIIVNVLFYYVCKDSFSATLNSLSCGLYCFTSVIYQILFYAIMWVCLAFIVIAAFDYVFQKFQHFKELKMSKHEVKQEHKDMEGDPMVKSQRKQLHREFATENQTSGTKSASFVVTNPTHIAVGLRYERGATPLPIVVSKGENLLAKKIVDIAQKNNIPVVENIDIARALYEDINIDEYIPINLFEPIADILRWLQQRSTS